jgi:hypothetical protein
MQKYHIRVISGNEYALTVFAKDYDEARAYALEIDIEDMSETGEVETVVSSCLIDTCEMPVHVRHWDDVN